MRFLRPVAYGAGSVVVLTALFSGRYPDDGTPWNVVGALALFLAGWFCGIAALRQLILALFGLTAHQRRSVTIAGCVVGGIPLLLIGMALVERAVDALP